MTRMWKYIIYLSFTINLNTDGQTSTLKHHQKYRSDSIPRNVNMKIYGQNL